MKALIRNCGETVTEADDIPGIDWNNGTPLTNKEWFGGAYTLVQNYVPPHEDGPAQYEEIIIDDPDPIVEENEDDYVVIDRKRYSKAELRSLIE